MYRGCHSVAVASGQEVTVDSGDQSAGTEHRNRLEVRLFGGGHLGGEIPLDELAAIASRTQTLVTRLARSLTDRAGAGRTPAQMEDLNRLLLVGLRSGSPTTILDIAGPPGELELELGEVPADVGTQSMSLLADAIDAAVDPAVPLPELSDAALRSLDEWLAALAPYEQFEATTVVQGARRQRTTSPEAAMQELTRKRTGRVSSPSTEQMERAVEGRLYAVNLNTGRFVIEDDLGHSIALTLTGLAADEVADLLVRRRVEARGFPILDAQGRLTGLQAIRIDAASGIEGLDPEAFWQDVELGELVQGLAPLPAVEAFEIADLTADEVDYFWAAVEG